MEVEQAAKRVILARCFCVKVSPRVTTNSYNAADHIVNQKRILETPGSVGFGLFLQSSWPTFLLFLNEDMDPHSTR